MVLIEWIRFNFRQESEKEKFSFSTCLSSVNLNDECFRFTILTVVVIYLNFRCINLSEIDRL